MIRTLIGGLAVALATSVVSASTVTLEFGAGSRHNPLPGAPGAIQSNRGGVFNMTGALGSFTTFCIEYNETIAEGSYHFSVDTGAIAGGLGGGNPDPIGKETAELFRRWTAGLLVPAMGQTQRDFNNALQDAFWFLEEELGDVDFTAATASLGNSNYDFMSATAQSLIDSVWGTTAAVGRVRALNLYSIATGANRQSVLYIEAIPLPGAGALAFAGLFGIAAVRRRRMV